MPFFFILQTAFSLYMLIHATKRGAPQYWWLIILIPFGEWAYFLLVFLPSQKKSAHFARPFKAFFDKPPSVESLRRDLRHTPSDDNRMRLAQGLHDANDFSEANQLFSELLADNDTDREALFGYAQTSLALKDTAAAMTSLTHLLAQKLNYRDYAAAFELCSLYWKADREDECVKLLQRVCKKTQRLEPRIKLARYLSALKRDSEARILLETGLDMLAGSPTYTRRAQSVHAWQAKRLLRDLPS